ncbi:DoxX family protein [Flavobacterium sp. XGLA_31]|uniref:DoxX family protein n=1 Tax=Flavobacterium sp. XGLA_31 TaxID=3447666 RepID=UPI003F393C9F
MKNKILLAKNQDLGILILRIGLGGLMLFHGADKVIHGIDYISDSLAARGLPESIANGVYIGEILVPALLLLGIHTRKAAFVYAVNMLFSIWLIYADQIFSLTPHGGWIIELNVLFLLGSLSLMFTGGGKYCFSKKTIKTELL